MVQTARNIQSEPESAPRPLIEELKANYTLTDVIRTVPARCFQRNAWKAYGGLAMTVSAVALGYLAMYLVRAAWFLPLFWLFTGTAMTGLFMLGHECAHLTFSGSRSINSLIGHLVLTPLFYPFHGWRITHNRHHAHTNDAELEEAWKPISVDEYRALPPLSRLNYSLYRGYFWWLATVYYSLAVTMNPWQYEKGKDRSSACSSIAIVALWIVAFVPTVVRLVGGSGLVIYFVIPWLVFHFWNSTFTLIHHTHPDIPYEPSRKWAMVSGQLYSTVHCTYPRWVEILCHDINVHIPHHCSTAIPSYNLREAYAAIRERWQPYLHETRFSWRTMSDIIHRCYVRDETGRYVGGRDPLSSTRQPGP